MRKIMRKNKRGEIGMILFFLTLLTVLMLGFMFAMGWAIVDYASSEITPIMTSLGVVGELNLSEVGLITFGNLDRLINAFSWVIGLGYVMALLFTVVFIYISGYSPHPAFLGLFLSLMVLLIFGGILMSNMYQDIYMDDDPVISARLQEQTLLSYMILHSPTILAIIAIFGGIIMFTRIASNDGRQGVSV